MADHNDMTAPGLTFVPAECDVENALHACLRMAAIVERSSEWDSGEVGDVMGLAARAFPGLLEFVSKVAEHEGKYRNVQVDLSALPEDCRTSTIVAAAQLAVVGAVAELDESFEWDDVERVGNTCVEAAANAPTASTGPRLG